MKAIRLQARDSVLDLRRAIRESTDADQKTRIRVIIDIKEGAAKKTTAKRFVVSRTSVISWVEAYNDGGIEALAMSKGGRKEGNPVWDISIFKALAEEIDKGGYWSIPKMQEWISEHHGKDIPEQTVWHCMNKLGYSYKSARPHPVQGDKERQDSFKKGASPPFWSR
jgi:transposase